MIFKLFISPTAPSRLPTQHYNGRPNQLNKTGQRNMGIKSGRKKKEEEM